MSRRKEPHGAGDTSLLAAAAEWRLLGLLVERPRTGWRAEIEALGREAPDVDLHACAAVAASAREGEYLSLVGPGGAVSPREVAYRGYEDPGWVLAEVASFYAAFAFRPRAEDPLDHIAVEAGFVGYMFLKEAFARAGGDPVQATRTAAARNRFMETHLAPLAAAFADRLAGVGPSYLATVARLLAARVPKVTCVPAMVEEAEVFDGCGACSFSVD